MQFKYIHKNYGAKFISFSDYSMPISYTDWIINEHLHTRKLAGIFDVAHMGQILISADDYNSNELKKFIPINFNNLKHKKCYYTFILNKHGGIVDDIILSLLTLIIMIISSLFIMHRERLSLKKYF